MNPPVEAPPGPFRRLPRRFWYRFLLACAVVLALEAVFEHAVENEDFPGITQSVFNISGLYQRIVASPRDPIVRYTQVVIIDPEKDPSVPGLTEVCEQRQKMTILLRNMAKALPDVIVFDKYFSKSCPGDAEFIQTVQDLRRNTIPVVVGRRIADESSSANSEKNYYLLPSLALGEPCQQPCLNVDDSTKLQEGVVNIDPDTRRLPLQWWVFPGTDAAKEGKGGAYRDTLALSAARSYNDQLLNDHPRLARFIKSEAHPYISFLKAADFQPIPVGDLLKPDAVVEAASGSPALPKLSPQLRKLSGKIVLIGEINPDVDEHPTVVGRMSGVYLQANYIEALMDDRYYRPVPVLDYAFGFLILAALELILIAYRDRWLVMAGLIALLMFAAAFVLYLFIKLPGWYVNPVPVGAAAVLIKVLHVLFAPAERELEAAEHPPAHH